jgi:glycosyltransferase involved in cell wall biosynthesis
MTMQVLVVMTARVAGGAEFYVERLVRALSGSCDFTVAMSRQLAAHELGERIGRHSRVITFPFEDAVRLPSVLCDLQRLARDYDLVHLISNHPASRLGIAMGFVLPRAGKPVVCGEQLAAPVSTVQVPRSVAWALPALFRWSRRRAARVVAVSRDNERVLVETFGLPAGLIEVVYNGVDLAPFSEQALAHPTLKEELGLDASRPLILVLARLVANKGHAYLLEAAPAILARFPGAYFAFAGSPDGRAEIEQQIEALGLRERVSILGFREDTVALLRGSDVFVLPSLAEGFSLSIIEALAAGLPVVATRVGGAAEAITDGVNGYLVPPADPGALAIAVNRVLELDPLARERLRQAAIGTARRFSSQVMAENMLSLYRRVLTPGNNIRAGR